MTHISEPLAKIAEEFKAKREAALQRPRLPCRRCGKRCLLDFKDQGPKLDDICPDCIIELERQQAIKIARERAAARLRDCGLPQSWQTVTLDHLRARNQNQLALKAAQESLQPSAKGLLLIGPTGCGKTLLLSGILHQLVVRNNPIYVNGNDLAQRFERHRFDEDDYIPKLLDHDVLVIDELTFTGQPHAFVADSFNRLADLIYASQRGRHRIKLYIATNHNLKIIEAFFQERFLRRLADCCRVIEMK